jgi:hypothetical protein
LQCLPGARCSLPRPAAHAPARARRLLASRRSHRRRVAHLENLEQTLLPQVLGKKAVRPFVPDFSTAFDHVCIHTGGRGVIDEIEKHLALSRALVEPSRAALFRCVRARARVRARVRACATGCA